MSEQEQKVLNRSWETTQNTTGYSRQQWLEFFEDHQQKNHAELAQVVREKLGELAEAGQGSLAGKNLDWWAQSVTVTYEQEVGRRSIGQRCDGTFGAGASKTVALGLDQLAQSWVEFAETLPGINGFAWESEPRITSSEKWRYWRSSLENGAPVVMNMHSKTEGKSVIAAEVQKLETSEDVTEFKAALKDILSRFAEYVK